MTGVLELLWKHAPDLVLHEMPPVGTGPFMRGTYSSVTAAVAVRCAATTAALPIAQVSAQEAKNVLTGNPKAKKPEVRKAVNKLIEDGSLFLNPETKIRLNEHIVDAIALILELWSIVMKSLGLSKDKIAWAIELLDQYEDTPYYGTRA